MKKWYIRGYIAAAFAVFLICIAYYYSKDYKTLDEVQSHVDGDMITFGFESGFYENSISVNLIKDIEVPDSARIYYTLDGDDPDIGGKEYKGPIYLALKDGVKVYPLKAIVYYEGKYSDIYERTYILCNGVDKELDVDIVSITSDSHNLYDYNTGILVPGKTFDKNLKESKGGFVAGNYSNRSEEWIRSAHMTMCDSNRNLILDQNIGLGVSGGSSVAFDVKALKVYADYAYDKNYDDFYIDINTEGVTESAYSFVNRYNSIRLRAGSQDMEFGNIRSSVVSRLAQSSGFDGCTGTRRCIVFLNGKYYGIFDMQQNYSDSYLAKRFNLEYPDKIEKQKGHESTIFSQLGISRYFDSDLDNVMNREVLEEHIDMDNYLIYYAINILCNNTDWPDNNFEMWRYRGKRDDSNPYTDNRYRFLIYDTDLVFPTEMTPPFFAGCQEDTFVSLMENLYQASGSTFSKVMTSAYYRDKFITMVTDLLNTAFSKENLTQVILEENEKIDAVRREYYDAEYIADAESCIDELLWAAWNRPEEMEKSFSYYFGLNERYSAAIEASEGIAVIWNHMNLFAEDSYFNQYYKGTEWTLEQEAYPGYMFEYWLVNEEKIYGESLTITDDMILDGRIDIRVIAAKKEPGEVILSEISARGHSDWMRISSVGKGEVLLNQYYLSDDENNLKKFQLPEAVLGTGDSIVIYGSKNRESVGDYICNFSLKEGETLYLSDENGILFSLPVPGMSDTETYGRYDNSGIWRFFRMPRVEILFLTGDEEWGMI